MEDIGRSWETGAKSRIGGYGTVGGEMLTALMADEMLMPGAGQIKCLLNVGGNPAAAVPDQAKMIRALESLDLLVSMEPYMTATAALSDYILPPRMPFERADLHLALFETAIYGDAYARYTPAVASAPENSELCDEWYVLLSLAARLDLRLTCNGVKLDATELTTEDELIALVARNAPVAWEEIKNAPMGYLHEEPMFALPPDPATAVKFTTVPADVQVEIEALWKDCQQRGQETGSSIFTHRLATRRSRHRFNTIGHFSPYLKRLVPYNPAYLHPDEMSLLALKDGDWIEIRSDHGSIQARAESDPTVRCGVVSITHCFGYLSDSDDYDTHAVSINSLISTDRDLQDINAMPRMSGIPVAITPVSQAAV